MNYGEMQDKIIFRTGNRTDLASTIKDNINRAYLDISTRQKFTAGGKIIVMPHQFTFPQLEVTATITTQAAKQDYTLSTDVIFVFGVKNITDDTPITLKTFRDFYKYLYSTTSGDPAWAYVQHTTIYFYPVPNAEKSIRYWYKKRPTALVNNNDPLLLPEEWGEAVFLLSSAMTFFDLLENDKAMTHMQLLENWIIEHLDQAMLYLRSTSAKSIKQEIRYGRNQRRNKTDWLDRRSGY